MDYKISGFCMFWILNVIQWVHSNWVTKSHTVISRTTIKRKKSYLVGFTKKTADWFQLLFIMVLLLIKVRSTISQTLIKMKKIRTAQNNTSNNLSAELFCFLILVHRLFMPAWNEQLPQWQIFSCIFLFIAHCVLFIIFSYISLLCYFSLCHVLINIYFSFYFNYWPFNTININTDFCTFAWTTMVKIDDSSTPCLRHLGMSDNCKPFQWHQIPHENRCIVIHVFKLI